MAFGKTIGKPSEKRREAHREAELARRRVAHEGVKSATPNPGVQEGSTTPGRGGITSA